jgi:hypothetical protein
MSWSLVELFRRHACVPVSILAVALSILTMSACTVYEPVPVYAPPSKFDRAWDAARGAAADLGVDVISADRSTGVIRGTKNANDVTMSVRTQADGSVRVEINTQPLSASADPTLAHALSDAYDRRMGR